jgi:hypothetical protein
VEPFALTISAEALFEDDAGEFGENAQAQLRTELADLDLHGSDIEFDVGSAGYGADSILAVVVLTGLAGLFMAGKKIEDNLDAWVRLGTRFRKFLRRLSKSHRGVSVSQPVALALVIARILEVYPNVNCVEVAGAHLVPVANPNLSSAFLHNIKYQPDRVYVFVLVTSAGDTLVAAIRSSGGIEFLQRLPTGDWLEYFGVSAD